MSANEDVASVRWGNLASWEHRRADGCREDGLCFPGAEIRRESGSAARLPAAPLSVELSRLPHEPAPQVDDLDAVPVGCFVTGFGDDSLGIRVANFPQGRDLSFEGAFLRDVVAHLDIEALSLLSGHEVNLFLVENASQPRRISSIATMFS